MEYVAMNNKLILSSIILTLSGVSLYSFAVNPKGYSSINIPKKGGAGASVVIGYDSTTEAGIFSTIVGPRSKIDS